MIACVINLIETNKNKLERANFDKLYQEAYQRKLKRHIQVVLAMQLDLDFT